MPIPPIPSPQALAPAAPLWRLMLDAALFGLCGIVLLIIGYYLWELITPYNLRREIHEIVIPRSLLWLLRSLSAWPSSSRPR